MHDAKHRQLSALVVAMIFAALATARAEDAAAQGLQAAGTMAAALTRRDAEPAEWQKLERIYSELAARHPRDATVRDGYAQFLWNRNERERARREWKAAEELDPKNAAVLQRLADAHLAEGDGPAAARYFQKACDAAPTNARCRYAAGNALYLFRHELVDAATSEVQILETALAHFAAAARLAPLEVEYARAYAETFYGVPKADWETAARAWEHFIEVTPNKDFGYANLARVRLKMGQHDAAFGCLDMIHGSDFVRLKANLREQIERARQVSAGR